MGIAKIYDPLIIENKWLVKWEKEDFFKSEPNEKTPYTILIPPPNVTGILHMGHMLNNTIQDILIRKARLSGYNACWVPGTDHASIATEAKVVNKLKEIGIKKHELTRDEFLEHAWDWTNKHGGIILNQLKKIGCSCDWSRTKFTLDKDMYESVQNMFLKLYDDGYLYRDKKIVNWDPEAKTTLSNEEVIYKEKTAKLFYLKYKLESSEEFILVATTRPETIFGDTAVAVNPNDKRYKKLVGKKLIVPLVNRVVPIIGDKSVDSEFGTGCLKVTPAHSEKDFEIGIRNNLDIIDIFNDDASLNDYGMHYKSLDRFSVRKKIINELDEKGLLDRAEDYTHNIALSERTSCVVEPKLSTQWFVRMKKLSNPALDLVLDGDIQFYPKKYVKTYKNWLENIRDWNISRQLYWGHRIPVFYLKEDKSKYVVCLSSSEAIKLFEEKYKIKDLNSDEIVQDEDVLDTWFSSWLWPISVFDGVRNPNNSEIEYYYPTSDLVTGPDIIFFWVARMIISGNYLRQDIPFRNVYFTGLVRDKKGRKMSKQLGNSPDPEILIKKYGADGVRVGLLFCAPAGNDLLFDETLCNQGKNFSNKIWNAFRLIDGLKIDDSQKSKSHNEFAIKRFNENLNMKVLSINESFKNFKISEALMTLYKLFWDDFCSIYLEIIKPEFGKGVSKKLKRSTLTFLEKLLTLLHPFMPFITSEIIDQIISNKNFNIIKSNWPESIKFDSEIIENVNYSIEIVSKIRHFKKQNTLSFKDDLKIYFENDLMDNQIGIVKKLTNCDLIKKQLKGKDSETSFIVGKYGYVVDQKNKIFNEIDVDKLKEELNYNLGFKNILEKKLSNENFVSNAPKEVIQKERKKLEDVKSKIKILEEGIKKQNN
ncbi:MAG: valine--tRNA ligase [Flavobacteriaceae bacterium]|nr:MAG: valine--tRNA ligase [Flavobacteriaceae bacterium]